MGATFSGLLAKVFDNGSVRDERAFCQRTNACQSVNRWFMLSVDWIWKVWSTVVKIEIGNITKLHGRVSSWLSGCHYHKDRNATKQFLLRKIQGGHSKLQHEFPVFPVFFSLNIQKCSRFPKTTENESPNVIIVCWSTLVIAHWVVESSGACTREEYFIKIQQK